MTAGDLRAVLVDLRLALDHRGDDQHLVRREAEHLRAPLARRSISSGRADPLHLRDHPLDHLRSVSAFDTWYVSGNSSPSSEVTARPARYAERSTCRWSAAA